MGIEISWVSNEDSRQCGLASALLEPLVSRRDSLGSSMDTYLASLTHLEQRAVGPTVTTQESYGVGC